jgi:hypothetical protein
MYFNVGDRNLPHWPALPSRRIEEIGKGIWKMFELIPPRENSFHPDEVVFDSKTGLLLYKGKFDKETGTIIEPQLLFNGNPSLPLEDPLEAPKEKPREAIGPTKSSSEDSPLLYGGWRNPNYEELRYVYVRDGIIVDHEGVSCGIPGAAGICLGHPDEYMRYMRGHIERLGADTVYMIHNHTEGDPTPSDADIAATAFVFRNIPQLNCHMIINSGKYAVIDPDGKSYAVLPLPNLPADWIDPILQPLTHHHLLGRIAKGTCQIVAWTKALTSDSDSPLLVYLGKSLRIRGMARVQPRDFFDKAQMAEETPKKLVDFGVNGAVAVLPGGLSDGMLDVARELVRSHILWAAVGISENGELYGFAAEIPNPHYFGGKHRSTFAPYRIR